jgi:hypothetical protein
VFLKRVSWWESLGGSIPLRDMRYSLTPQDKSRNKVDQLIFNVWEMGLRTILLL